MSQVYKSSASGPVPPSVATSYVTNSGTAVPVANILNVLAEDTSIDNDNGIRAIGSGNTVTIQLTNRVTGSVTTTDGSTVTLVSLSLGASAAVYAIRGSVCAIIPATGDGAGYFFEGTVRTNGVTATLIGGEFTSFQEDVSFSTGTEFVNFTTSGNAAVIEVTGNAATTINWYSLMNYIKVS